MEMDPYVGRLKGYEHALLVSMTKSQVRLINILLAFKENNVTIIKQLYNVRYIIKDHLEDYDVDRQNCIYPNEIEC